MVGYLAPKNPNGYLNLCKTLLCDKMERKTRHDNSFKKATRKPTTMTKSKTKKHSQAKNVSKERETVIFSNGTISISSIHTAN